jgi:amino acid permease/DNA-binding MarR family transcriptional regulator
VREQKAADADLFSREEVLAGLPGRRASLLLFLIESRTAHLVALSRRTMERFLTEEAAHERDLALLETFSRVQEVPVSRRPSIQNLERFAADWGDLVPDNPRLQAALAHALAEKHRLVYRSVPGIRAALGLDREPVRQAYQRLYSEPLDAAFARPVSPQAIVRDWVGRLRWLWLAVASRLESLPPFWTAFALVLTETVGAGILALPIAVAGVGPLAGAAILAVFGLVNVLTIAYMSEAVARSGTIRYGSAYIGRVVATYLGNAGSLILTLGVALLCLLSLLAYFVGFSGTLADATSVPAELWTALLFLIGLYFLRRQSLDATVASALFVGAVNIAIILALSALALAHAESANLSYVNLPFLGGRPFDASILQLIFGTILNAYFGHMSVSTCAKVVLRRDPSARSLIWGSITATAVTMILYCLWVVAVNGAVPARLLVGQAGTALAPLATRVGPAVHVLGSVFAILGMGMGSIHACLGLFNLVREWLPVRHQPVVVLPRGRGRLTLHRPGRPNGFPRLGLTYLGLEMDRQGPPGDSARPRLRLDLQLQTDALSWEFAIADRWESAPLLSQLPGPDQRAARLSLELLAAGQESARLRIASPLAMAYEGEWGAAGFQLADMLTGEDGPSAQQQILIWMTRQGEVSLADVAAHLDQDEPAARAILDELVDKGLVSAIGADSDRGEARYRVHLAARRGRRLAGKTGAQIWKALDDKAELPEGISQAAPHTGLKALAHRTWETMLGDRGRFLLSASPVAFVFLLTEWLSLVGAESFTGPFNFAGVIVVSLLGGIFPVLLLASSRQKGEVVPGLVYRFLGNPFLLGAIYLLSLAALFLHGLVIWTGPVERASALVVGVAIVGVTVVLARRGVFAPRLVLELRQAQGEEEAVFSITAGGRAAEADVQLAGPQGEQHFRAATGRLGVLSSLRRLAFALAASPANDLELWAHRINRAQESEALPVVARVECGRQVARVDLKLGQGGQVVLPLAGGEYRVEITPD